MDIIAIILLAIGLAMDSVAVSLAYATQKKNLSWPETGKIAFFFGLFQGAMPVLGFFGGLTIKQYIQQYDHWLALIILTFIGGKMLWEAWNYEEESDIPQSLSWPKLFFLAVATSIDALAVGIGLSVLVSSILMTSLYIGAITFILSLLALYLGKALKRRSSRYAEFLGGMILIAIGIKIFYEHISQGI